MIENKRLYERLGLVGVVNSQLANNTTKSTGYVAVATIGRFLAVLNLGATDTTVDFKVTKHTDSSGSGSADVAAITQISSSGDNQQAMIDIDTAALGDGYTHIRATATIGSGSTGANIAVDLWAGDVRYGEEKDKNIVGVVEVKTA